MVVPRDEEGRQEDSVRHAHVAERQTRQLEVLVPKGVEVRVLSCAPNIERVVMKSLSIRGIAGNAKLRGKRTHVLNCGCCDLQNFKWKSRWKEAANEIKYSKSDSSQVLKRA